MKRRGFLASLAGLLALKKMGVGKEVIPVVVEPPIVVPTITAGTATIMSNMRWASNGATGNWVLIENIDAPFTYTPGATSYE